MRNEEIKVTQIDYHRNGISGEGFTVCLFKYKEGRRVHNMVGILFGRNGQCAVLDVQELQDGNIEFAKGNSWRGDYFEPTLRKAKDKFFEEVMI